MIKVSLDDAKDLSLADAVRRVSTSKETMLVAVPGGAVVKVAPVSAPQPAYMHKGRPVYTQEQLAAMSTEQLEAIGWIYPDESKWVEDLLASPA